MDVRGEGARAEINHLLDRLPSHAEYTADGSLGTPPLSNDSEAIATVGTSVLAR